MRQQRGPQGLALLLIGEGVKAEVSNTDNGVNLTITAAEAEEVPKVQGRAQMGVKRLQEAAERARKPEGAEGGPPVARRGILKLLAAGTVEIGVENVENGVVVSFTSDKPGVAANLQEKMPEWVATAQQRGQQMDEAMRRWQYTRQALAVLAKEEVTLEVKEVENGLVVTVTADDPEIAEQIKQRLSDYFKGQKDFAKAMEQGGPRRGPSGPRFGPPPGVGRGPRGPHAAPPPPPPAE
jgi:hypothetical protein